MCILGSWFGYHSRASTKIEFKVLPLFDLFFLFHVISTDCLSCALLSSEEHCSQRLEGDCFVYEKEKGLLR